MKCNLAIFVRVHIALSILISNRNIYATDMNTANVNGGAILTVHRFECASEKFVAGELTPEVDKIFHIDISLTSAILLDRIKFIQLKNDDVFFR